MDGNLHHEKFFDSIALKTETFQNIFALKLRHAVVPQIGCALFYFKSANDLHHGLTLSNGMSNEVLTDFAKDLLNKLLH